MLPLCLLLRTLWGGASFQLQMMPTGFEGLLHHVLKLQELQHVLLHAATTNNNPQQTLATCFAPQVPPEIDVVQRAGRWVRQRRPWAHAAGSSDSGSCVCPSKSL